LDSFLFQLIKNKKIIIDFEVTEQSSVIILYLNYFYFQTVDENPGKSCKMICFSMVLYQPHISKQMNVTSDHTDWVSHVQIQKGWSSFSQLWSFSSFQ